MQASEKISSFVAGTKEEDIPEVALQQAKASISDWLFVALAGRAQSGTPLQGLCEQALGSAVPGQSSVLGRSEKTTENHAALINGYAGHLLDYDETCPKIRSHLFAPIFPAVLAASEARGVSGRRMLSAFVIGHEVAMRVGEAMTPGWIRAGWHGTSLFGIFGAAAGCARLMGLDHERIRMALGLATSMAGGLAVNFGSLTKPLHVGMAAERGLFAAQLAKHGFTASPDALEGPLGFYHAFHWGEAVKGEVFDSLGRPWGLETPGMSAIKLYPCCHGLTTNIECGIRIHDRSSLGLEDIDSIEIHSQPKTLCAMLSKDYADGENIQWGYQGPPRRMKSGLPETGLQGKFSKEYAFSRALKDGQVRMHHMTDEAVRDPEILPWMEKVQVFHNGELETTCNQFPEETGPHGERMIVHLKNGDVIEEEEIFILGMSRRPLALEDVRFKYQDCGSVAGLPPEEIDTVLSLVASLEQLDDLTPLLGHVSG
ncbi:MAG: MmgE/PrpD family protein [Desulfobacteraceae bacterium]|jgi:2-methylcitrate dehydratase PrpD